MGNKREPRLELFYLPFVAGIELPHQGVLDSYNVWTCSECAWLDQTMCVTVLTSSIYITHPLNGFIMMTSSNGNIFRVTGPLCGEFPTQRPVTRSFDVLFDLRLNKRLSKQPWGWWFETPSWSLWRHRNDCPHLIDCGLTKPYDVVNMGPGDSLVPDMH